MSVVNGNGAPEPDPIGEAMLEELDFAASLVLKGLGFAGVIICGIYENEQGLALLKTAIARDGAELTMTLVNEIGATISTMQLEIKEGQ